MSTETPAQPIDSATDPRKPGPLPPSDPPPANG